MDLSPRMREVLGTALQAGEIAQGPRQTLNALRRRNLLDADGSLTPEGKRAALTGQPLAVQCEHLGFPLNTVEVDSVAQPERTALAHFRSQGWQGSASEGGAVFIVLKSALLPKLVELNTFGSLEDACRRYLEAQLKILAGHEHELVDALRSVGEPNLTEHFQELFSYSYMRERHPDLSTDLIRRVFNSLTCDQWASTLRTVIDDPYRYRKGWPDLTLVRDHSLRLVEVKTTDRLTMSQLTTIPTFAKIMGDRFSVVQLESV